MDVYVYASSWTLPVRTSGKGFVHLGVQCTLWRSEDVLIRTDAHLHVALKRQKHDTGTYRGVGVGGAGAHVAGEVHQAGAYTRPLSSQPEPFLPQSIPQTPPHTPWHTLHTP